jgi:hypothetical protein
VAQLCNGYRIFICVIFGSGGIIAATEEPTMHPKLVVAILVATAVAVYARAQGPNQVATIARRVVEIISRDPAKIETYCAVGKLSVQIEDANGAKDDGKNEKVGKATRSRISFIDVRTSDD